MEPEIGTRMKVSPDLTGLNVWQEGDVIDIEHNPFKGLVVAIKDSSNRIYFGEAKYFMPIWHMFAISFDLSVRRLQQTYGEPYNNAYYEVGKVLREFGFYNVQGSVYLTEGNDMSMLFRAMESLKHIPWFKASVRDIRAFRVEDWSDFTSYFSE